VALSWLRGKHLILAITAPIVVILDQVTKALAAAHLKPLVMEMAPSDRYLTVIDGFFRLKYAENTGAAWGLLRDAAPGFRIPFFIGVSLVAIVVIVWFYRRIGPKQKLLPLGISLVLGGAVGNLIDRVLMGKVIDFIDWYLTIGGDEKHWPTFNIADAAITVGVAILMIEMIFGKNPEAAQEEQAEG